MTETLTVPESPASSTDWNTAFQTLRARYPKVREAIVVALHILMQNPDISLDDAKAQASLHGVRITAASVSAAQRLLSRQDAAPAPKAAPAAVATQLAKTRTRRAAKPDAPVDIEGVVRDAVTRISAKAAADAERLRAAVRKAIDALEAVLAD